MVTPYLSRLNGSAPGSGLRPRARSRFEPPREMPIDGAAFAPVTPAIRELNEAAEMAPAETVPTITGPSQDVTAGSDPAAGTEVRTAGDSATAARPGSPPPGSPRPGPPPPGPPPPGPPPRGPHPPHPPASAHARAASVTAAPAVPEPAGTSSPPAPPAQPAELPRPGGSDQPAPAPSLTPRQGDDHPGRQPRSIPPTPVAIRTEDAQPGRSSSAPATAAAPRPAHTVPPEPVIAPTDRPAAGRPPATAGAPAPAAAAATTATTGTQPQPPAPSRPPVPSPQPPQPPQPPLPSRAVSLRPRGRRHALAAEDTTAGPTEITVTIGRVEVRAPGTAPAPSPRGQREPRRRPPTLDDYLRARSGGRPG
jgi:hypothetical protein